MKHENNKENYRPDLHLSKEAKARIRAALQSHMHVYPARLPSRTRAVVSPYTHFLKAPAFALILVFILGGGTAFASSKSIPGDILYPVKVSLVEPVQEILAVSSESKARFNVERVDIRLKEAERIVVFSDDDETKREVRQEALEEEFDVALVRAQASLDILSEKKPEVAEKVAEEFKNTLAYHRENLQELHEKKNRRARESGRSLDSLVQKIDEASSRGVLAKERGDAAVSAMSATLISDDEGGHAGTSTDTPDDDQSSTSTASTTEDGGKDEEPTKSDSDKRWFHFDF